MGTGFRVGQLLFAIDELDDAAREVRQAVFVHLCKVV